jgi:hypothetical protein
LQGQLGANASRVRGFVPHPQPPKQTQDQGKDLGFTLSFGPWISAICSFCFLSKRRLLLLLLAGLCNKSVSVHCEFQFIAWSFLFLLCPSVCLLAFARAFDVSVCVYMCVFVCSICFTTQTLLYCKYIKDKLPSVHAYKRIYHRYFCMYTYIYTYIHTYMHAYTYDLVHATHKHHPFAQIHHIALDFFRERVSVRVSE